MILLKQRLLSVNSKSVFLFGLPRHMPIYESEVVV